MSVVRIIIVNYRTAGLVVECLRSLAAEVAAEPDCRVVVVDNASGDGSAEAIGRAVEENGWGAWVELQPLGQNRGFAAGNNHALRPLLAAPRPPDHVLLLNPDTVVRPGAVRELAAFLEARPDVGLAGSRLEDPDGTPQRSAFRFHTAASEFEGGLRLGLVSRLLRRRVVAPPPRPEPHPADWVAGASLLVRRAVFESVGLLDEGYFLYFEEVDFCRRARAAGWPCWYVPASRVVHLVGQSSGVTDGKRPPRRVPRYWFDSRRRYFRKNHGRPYALLADAAWVLGFSLWRLRRRIQRRPDRDPPGLLWDFLRYNYLSPEPLP
jgi:GT2 family glycosyltransferase